MTFSNFLQQFQSKIFNKIPSDFFINIHEKNYDPTPTPPIITIYPFSKKIGYIVTVVDTIIYHSYINGTPSQVECTIYKDSSLNIELGDMLTLTTKYCNYFKGKITKIEIHKKSNNLDTYKIIAQDQLLYFKQSKDSYSYENITLNQLVTELLKKLNLSTINHELYSTKTTYKLSATNEINKSYYQMFKNARDRYTLFNQNEKKIFFLFDYFGSIILKSQYDLISNFYIRSLKSYLFVKELTPQTITKIKFDFKEKQNNFSYAIFENTSTLKKWGTLQRYEPQVTYNFSMATSIAKLLFAKYGKETQSYQLNNILPNETIVLFAGCSFNLYYETSNHQIQQKICFISECIHHWKNQQHLIDIIIKEI